MHTVVARRPELPEKRSPDGVTAGVGPFAMTGVVSL